MRKFFSWKTSKRREQIFFINDSNKNINYFFKLHQLKQTIIFDYDNENKWRKYCCLFDVFYIEFKQKSQKCLFKNFKHSLNNFQLYEIYWILKTKRLINEKFLYDNINLDKINKFVTYNDNANWLKLIHVDSNKS